MIKQKVINFYSNKKLEISYIYFINYIDCTNVEDLDKALKNNFNCYEAHINNANLFGFNKSIAGKFLGI